MFYLTGFFERGLALFFVTPLFGGVVGAMVLRSKRAYTLGRGILMDLSAYAMMCLILFAFQFEAAVCLAIAFPLGVLTAFIGTIVVRPPRSDKRRKALTMGLALLPLLAGSIETPFFEESEVVVTSSVTINATPDQVWQRSIEFPDIPDADSRFSGDWTFVLGYPRPLRAERVGEGVGSLRYAIFTEGKFDARVSVWQPGRELSFTVAANHHPHTDVIETTRGQILLTDLGDGRTRVDATSWYRLKLKPAVYWQFWTDVIVLGIHQRMLDHVKDLAEADAKAAK